LQGIVDVTDIEVEMEAERMVVEEFVHRQHTDTTSHCDILVLDPDVDNSRVPALSRKLHKKSKQRYFMAAAF